MSEALFTRLAKDVKEWSSKSYACDEYPLIGEILAYQKEEDNLNFKFLRRSQFLALEVYVVGVEQEGLVINQLPQAAVKITEKGKKAIVKIKNFISPTILAHLDIDRSLFNEHIDDFRAQIDYVLIDTNHDGKKFNIVISDRLEKKTDFIKGKYELTLPRATAKIAVKIVDMLGEEILEIA